MDAKVEQFLLKLPDAKREVAMMLREIMLASDKSISEAIKWNQLTFMTGKKNFAFIYTYPQVDYMNLGFFKATSLDDPKGLFEGTGAGMRHIKVKGIEKIPAAQIKKWVKQAVLIESR